MKKKIFGLAAMMFTAAALVACGGKPAVDSDHKHKFDTEDTTKRVEATCQAAGKKVMKCSCGETKDQTIAKLTHQYEDIAGGTEATCDAAGVQKQKCKLCQGLNDKTLPALGHDYQDLADQTGAVPATCTTDGTKKQKCSRCTSTKDAVVEKLGHEWVDDGDTTTAEAASCTFSGSVPQKCSHTGCTATNTRTVQATGHEFAAQGTPVAAVEDKDGDTLKGYTKVGYTKEFCSKDNVTRISWDAKQVTTACNTPKTVNRVTSGQTSNDSAVWEEGLEPNYVTDGEGVKFWGRAIGNAQILNDSGDATQNAHVHEPEEHIEGSYFEYKINLPEAANSVRLIANIKAAQYTGNNDMFAATGAENDWTPGYQKGNDGNMHIVNDWRYVLFVDGVQVRLDRTMRTACLSEREANWYTLPMKTMNLDAGDHTIKLVMAGGYKHTFYNFGLETAVQHEHNVVRGEKAANSDLHAITCKCNKLTGYELDATECDGANAPDLTNTATRLGQNYGGKEDVWDITGIAQGEYEVQIEGSIKSDSYWDAKVAIDHSDDAKNNGNVTTSTMRYGFQIDEEAVVFPTAEIGAKKYSETGLKDYNAQGDKKGWSVTLCNVMIKTGATSLKMISQEVGYSLFVFGVRLVKVSDFVY